jgi:tetrahydromethanopterin S-methyltransferase subunit G
MENLPERVDVIERKLDGLSASVDARFNQVDAAILEQRTYTEFAYEKLDAKMAAGFAQVDARFAQVDARFAQIDARFAQIDGRFAQIDGRFVQIDGRFAQIDARLIHLDDKLERRLGALDSKMTTQFSWLVGLFIGSVVTIIAAVLTAG